MADFTKARADLGFMRRRVRAGVPAQAPAAAGLNLHPSPEPPRAGLSLATPTPATTGSLNLAPSAAPQPAAAAVEASRLAPVLTVDGKHVLTDTDPVVRLNRRSSAIGSLRITGATYAAWETCTRETGILGRWPEPPAPGNRALVEQVGRDVIVGLRHIRRLRRLVVTGADITVTAFAGHTITVHGAADVYLSVIDGVIELRREPASGDIATSYSIGVPA